MGMKSLIPARGAYKSPVYDFIEDENECSGGHYSVTPDEVFHGEKKKFNGQKKKYQVMLNLHFGDKSTVWVCYDDDMEIKYWALKILSVDASKNTREHLAEDYIKKSIDMLEKNKQENQRCRYLFDRSYRSLPNDGHRYLLRDQFGKSYDPQDPFYDPENPPYAYSNPPAFTRQPAFLNGQFLNSSGENDPEVLKKAICLPVDKFLVRGPKGNHQCFVYPLLGPQAQPGWMSELFEIVRHEDGLSPSNDKSFSETYYQLANAVRFIHSQQFCHGRIIPGNVLHRIQGLDGKRVNDVCAILRGGRERAMTMLDETGGEYRGPVYRIHKGAGDWKSRSVYWDLQHIRNYLTSDIALIGFGQCFLQSSPPSTLNIPESYQPPELMLKNILGPGTDLWTLGCTLYELRMGVPLLDFGSTDRIERLQCIVKVLEPLGGNVKDLESYGCPDLNFSRLSETKSVQALSDLKEFTLTFFLDDPPVEFRRVVMPRGRERKAFRTLLKKLLNYDYEQRKGAEAIIKDDWVGQCFLPKRPSRRRQRILDALNRRSKRRPSGSIYSYF